MLPEEYSTCTVCLPAVRVVVNVAVPQVSQFASDGRLTVPTSVPSTLMVRVAADPEALAYRSWIFVEAPASAETST